MATARTKRALATRTNDVDRLASKLGSRLKISDAPNNGTRSRKETRTVQTTKGTRSSEEGRAAAMKSINNVLQSLASSAAGRCNTSPSTVSSIATAGRAALNILRKLNPELVDTERAALCMVGKLLVLDAHDVAAGVLEDIRKHLPSLYDHEQELTTNRTPVSLLQLPLPISPLDASLQTCIQTYLYHAFSVVTHVVSTRIALFNAFCNALDGPTCLRLWAVFLTALPRKSLDGLFKRAYVALTSTFTVPSMPPTHVLKIRFYALRILLLSSELDVSPFWEQCLKYAASYARDEESKESEAEKIIELLACFASIDKAADGRREGKGWIAFCEYWLALAKRAGNAQTLSVVAEYIRNAASSSNDLSQMITRACTTLTQLAASFDQPDDDDGELASRADTASSELHGLHASLSSGVVLDGKLLRIVEKCRKACTKALPRCQPGSSGRSAVVQILTNMIAFLEHIIEVSAGTSSERADATISALDSLFQLATVTLNPQRAETCDQAYDYLIRGLRLIERSPSDSAEDKRATANYLRCLAGALANLAGALYKAERHGFAIRFLMEACPLSTRASKYYSESGSADAVSKSEKDREVWKTHRAQGHRRWELLGICYAKTGDRSNAHEAFLQGVVMYPFEDEPSSGEFQLTPSLANAIDRLTHLGVSDLRLDPAKISLLIPLCARDVPPSIVGSILTRQACSLSDRSKPHVRMAVSALLKDILDIYDPIHFPIRRARTLVLVLEHIYYGADKDVFLSSFRPEDILQESGVVLSRKSSAGEDHAFIHLRQYYRATIVLWSVLHVHRAAESIGCVERHAQLALGALEALAPEGPTTIKVKVKNMGRGRKVESKVPSSKTSVSRTGRTAAVPSTKSRTARSNSTRRPPVTPNTTGGAVTNVPSSSVQSENRDMNISERTSLADLILVVTEMLDVSGLILLKFHFLIFVRRLLEKDSGAKSEVFLRASSMLAHMLSKLGKLSLASEILSPLATEVCESLSPSSSAVLLLLRYAETLALSGDVSKSITIYEKACSLADDLPDEESGKGVSAIARIRSRAVYLERVAIASSTFAIIQDAKSEPATSLRAFLQALRLLNRATDTLARLNQSRKPDSQSDPFAMSDIRKALPTAEGAIIDDKEKMIKFPQNHTHLDGLEWRIANALLETQLSLAQSYSLRGSVREAEYFDQQVEDLARMLGTSTVTARALLQKSELQMDLGNIDEARVALDQAMDLMQDANNLHRIDVHRGNGDRFLLCSQEADAEREFNEAAIMLTETQKKFDCLDKLVQKPANSESGDIFAPTLQAKILRQQVWLLRDVLGEKYEEALEKLFALPQLPYIEVLVNSVLGRLALYDIHERFRADMSLSCLAESTIALPMGMMSEKSILPAPPQDILDALNQADEHYVSDLSRYAERDSVINVRAAAVAAALISTYRASLGIAYEDSAIFASRLLDMASSIALRRELIDAINYKFPDPLEQDDMRWPSEAPLTTKRRSRKPNGRGIFDDLPDYDDDTELNDNLRQYWNYILKKHQSEAFIQPENSKSEIDSLPENWMVVTISLTEDKSALLVSRQRPKKDPMVFCIPLKGRRDDDEDGHFTFDDAVTELKDIISSSDEGMRGASQIKSDDKEAKIAWWASRKQLDQRMKDLVENIEFCWLGAFKTILSQPVRIPSDTISSLRTRFEKVFKGILGTHEKKSRKAKLRLETSLLELFATLPPTCRDEELQDLIYFVLDLYHFHGLPVALSEVDIDLVVIDLRTALEEHHSRNRVRVVPESDAHTFLVLDKNVQGIPWESLPILRGCSVSRVPSIAFITDRLALARCQKGLPLDPQNESDETSEQVDRIPIDPSKGYYVLNPSGDLSGTEGRFKGWANNLKKVGWDGVIGKEPSEQQFLNALSRKDLVVYFGHGGGEKYARSHRIRHLQRCAATMLWGCSSGALRDMGGFDRVGTPNNYMLAGCPSLVANLWDVTDRDIDKFAQSVFEKLRLEPKEVQQWQKGKRGLQDGKMSIVAAVAQSRDVCKLKYLTGAAVVVYGIPYYL